MKSIKEINDKIKKGNAVVLTAAEVKELGEKCSSEEIAEKVDVVTTATFGPMCSSGAFINPGHMNPHTKMQNVKVNGVSAYGGIATADFYIGATEENPEKREYGGAHVICSLIKGETVEIEVKGRPSDCYPGTGGKGRVKLEDLNQAYMYNPRNCYQNYNAAANSSERDMDTYMGKLRAGCMSVNFAGTGEISPLINDPYLKTIGIGTRIFCCGAQGFISWEGTQYNSVQERNSFGIPKGPGATLGITAPLRGMKPEFIRPVYIPGYGVSIYISVGIPIPVLNSEIASSLLVRNRDILTSVYDFSNGCRIREVSYEELLSGSIKLNGRDVPARTMTDLKQSMEITKVLKSDILNGNFVITESVNSLPLHGKYKDFG